MASGKRHALASVIASVPVGILIGKYTGSPDAASMGVVGCLMGVVLSPDLDLLELEKRIVPEQVMHKFPIIGVLFTIYWWPYAISIPHRHPLSHFPVLSTMFRVAYALAFPALLLSIILLADSSYIYTVIAFLTILWPDLALSALFGLLVSDTVHWMMDGRPR